MWRKTPDLRPAGELPGRERSYTWLSRRLLLFTVLCAVLPLLLLGWGLSLHFTRFSKERTVRTLAARLAHHRESIELFLEDRKARLKLLAATHELSEIADPEVLSRAFDAFNQDGWSIADLGVISGNGEHLAYEGPYDLRDKDYSEVEWFREVMDHGVYVSDMFLGFRNEPHFIIAVTRIEDGRPWILRATIDTEFFRSLVESVSIGKTGEVFLLNQEGVYQTSPRFRGEIMDRAEEPLPSDGGGIGTTLLSAERDARGREVPARVSTHVWLEEPHWLLMIRQDQAEAFRDVFQAKRVTLLSIHLIALLIVVVSFFITRRMLALVRRRDRQAEELNLQLLQAGKLASIGELSAGVAHEINNPLAIILTEWQILMDALGRDQYGEEAFRSLLGDSLDQVHTQIHRCQNITHKLLRFARRTESILDNVDLNSFLREIVELMEHEAQASGISFSLEGEDGLPLLRSDPSQLQQVFLNLITNAIDAHEGKPYGAIRLRTVSDPAAASVRVTCEDRGSGITPENLVRIFDPFFTTKAMGKGTGLGLSICMSIVRRLGGDLTAWSEPGRGTRFEVRLPIAPPPELLVQMAPDEPGDHPVPGQGE